MDPLVNVYAQLSITYPFLSDPRLLTQVAADHRSVTWNLYEYFRDSPRTAKADKAILQGLLAWWALQRLGKVNRTMGLNWSSPREVTSVEFESDLLVPNVEKALLSHASDLATIGDLVAQAYDLNDFNTDILDRYIQGPSKVPNPARLQIAFDKLPSQRDLEFLVPTFRVIDERGFGPIFDQFRTGVPFPLNGGGARWNRFTSTSVGYNTFTPSMGVDGGVILMFGYSGRYIGCFGSYGAVDGAEILYDPSTMVTAVRYHTVLLTKPKQARLRVMIIREVEERAPRSSWARQRYFQSLGY